MTTYDDPVDLARRAAALARPLLVAYDCDGVLAPIVDHADDAVLVPGFADELRGVQQLGVDVAVVSGRSLAGLRQFDLPPELTVVASHGAERRGRSTSPLDAVEADRLREAAALAERAREAAGDGAWIERKPSGVVLHVRQADPERARSALDQLATAASRIDGTQQKPGSGVLELIVRSANKGDAVVALREELASASCVFVGDDRTDEDAFATLGDGDLGIKVGPGETIATTRLRSPDEVLRWTRSLREIIDAEPQKRAP